MHVLTEMATRQALDAPGTPHWMTEMVDGTGTTTYSFTHAGGGVSVFSENGPWSNDTVTVTNQHGLRLGLGIQQPTGSWAARYVYDGMLIVQERNPSTPSVTYTRGLDLSGGLSGAGGIGGLLGRSTGYNTGTGAWSTHTSYHADGNGNVTGLLDSGGSLVASYHYNPWGGLLGITGSHASANSMRHASKLWFGWRGSNTDGLYYYGYRFYDPTTMRWVNRDPIGELGGMNLYSFVNNNPITRIDHLGLTGSDGDGNEGGQGSGLWGWFSKTSAACKQWCKQGWRAGPEKIQTGAANSAAGAGTRVINTVASGAEAGAGLTAVAAMSKPCNACKRCLSEACDPNECDAICAECERVKGGFNPNVLL